MNTNPARRARASKLIYAALPCAVALALSACGGGGASGAVRPAPPPPPVAPTGPGFTPNVDIDSRLTQLNPPAIPAQAAPISLTDLAINRHLTLTNALGALGAGLKGQGVTIGFLDSGVNRNHPTLAGRVTRNFVHVGAANDLTVDDKVGHGTVVASLAAGRPAQGLYSGGQTGNWGGGIAQNATVVSSRIISDAPPVDDGSGEGNPIQAGDGLGADFVFLHRQLADAGAKIINNSWGGLYWDDPALSIELAEAYKDFTVGRGGLIVFANGNSGDDPRFVGNPSDNAMLPTLANDPVLERGWLTVGALDPLNPTQLTDYSQQCGQAMNYCLVAPGDVVFIDPDATTTATGGLYQGGGTSYAAPLVSGAAAVVWSAFPYFSNDQVRRTILGGAKDLGAPGVDSVFGWGLLDVSKAAMGPSNLDMAVFDVTLEGRSVWRNPLYGHGVLTKRGGGILTLAESANHTGDTNVFGGALDVRKGLPSSFLTIEGLGTVYAAGTFKTVQNRGTFLVSASAPTVVETAYQQQGANSNLGIWLGNPLIANGLVLLDGQLSILGVRSGYTTTAKETIISIVSQGSAARISGTFSSLKAAPNVFLDATLSYEERNVFLNINRINVANAIAGMSLSAITQASAQRVESAMTAIDSQLAGTSPLAIGSNFIDAAGALQRSSSVVNADVSLRSLSGQLHAASTAMTFDAIDAGRRALNGRLDALSVMPETAGGWFRDLSSGGTLAQAGFDSVGVNSSGEMVGSDWRVGRNSVVGVAMNRLEQSSWLSDFGDRSRGRQRELQLYATTWRGDWYGQAQLASGSFQRQMQRNLLLGEMQDAVATQLAGEYVGASGEIGRRFEAGGVALTPYLGTQYVQVANDGFDESGQTGFGLRAHAWDTSRWQALAGLRASRGWRWGNADVSADARAEWQQTLATTGSLADASFTGLDQWAPLQGIGLAQRTQTFGVGLSAAFGGKAMFRFDLSRRASAIGDSNTASLQAMYRF